MAGFLLISGPREPSTPDRVINGCGSHWGKGSVTPAVASWMTTRQMVRSMFSSSRSSFAADEHELLIARPVRFADPVRLELGDRL
jgi:hypothetical protein